MEISRCPVCARDLPLNEAYWRWRTRGVEWRLSSCRECENARKRELRKTRSNTTHSMLIAGDLHFPEQDPDAWDVLLQIGADEKPDELILNGDVAEVLAFNQHGNDVADSWEAEKLSVAFELDKARKALGDPRVTWIEGNHETRIRRWCRDNDAMHLFPSVCIPASFDFDDGRMSWVPEKDQPIRRGSLLIMHGHTELGKWGSKYHCNKFEKYVGPGDTMIVGHVHRDQLISVPRADADGNRSARMMSLGCMRTMDPGWIQSPVHGWCHEFAMAYQVGELTFVYPIKIVDGQTVWKGKHYASKA